jgi:phosphoglycerate kinase
VLGGSKVSDKIEVIEALLGKVSSLAIGGAMANTFLAAQGHSMGKSKVEADKLALARTLIDKAKSAGVELLLPTDLVVAETLDADEGAIVSANAVPASCMALDIGPKSLAAITQRIGAAATTFWNGPMGMFERKAFAAGSFGVARALADSPGFTVVGGGDSAACVNEVGPEVAGKIKHISTGGGASLELMEGKKLPGIEALRTS